ncbi:hypothetical protein, partial [Chloroflexus sp.]|uniref:hypothetical protein n=1 Tax=Chloroflexus sp. TaxID=1904827 RepID=UPI002FD9BD17
RYLLFPSCALTASLAGGRLPLGRSSPPPQRSRIGSPPTPATSGWTIHDFVALLQEDCRDA